MPNCKWDITDVPHAASEFEKPMKKAKSGLVNLRHIPDGSGEVWQHLSA